MIASKAGFEKNVVVLSLFGPPAGPGQLPCARQARGRDASFFHEAVAVIESACEDFQPIG